MPQSLLRKVDTLIFPSMDKIGLYTYSIFLFGLLFFVTPVALKEKLTTPQYSTLQGDMVLKSSYNGIRGFGHTLLIYNNKNELLAQASCLGIKEQLCGRSQVSQLHNSSINFVSYLENKNGIPGRTYGSISEITDSQGHTVLKNSTQNIQSSFRGTRNSYYYLKTSVLVMFILLSVFILKILSS